MPRPCANHIEEKICRDMKEKTGVDYAPCKSLMVDEEEERTLYSNFDYFFDLASSGSSPWSYFSTEKAPCTWGSKDTDYDENHESNPWKLLPTWHELNAIYWNFDINLCGRILCKDTRESVENPPYLWLNYESCELALLEKEKLPPGWRKTLNSEKDRYYYWEEIEKKAIWNHPWPTFMDSMKQKLYLFTDLSDNFTVSIHGNMDFKETSIYEILGVRISIHN